MFGNAKKERKNVVVTSLPAAAGLKASLSENIIYVACTYMYSASAAGLASLFACLLSLMKRESQRASEGAATATAAAAAEAEAEASIFLRKVVARAVAVLAAQPPSRCFVQPLFVYLLSIAEKLPSSYPVSQRKRSKEGNDVL